MFVVTTWNDAHYIQYAARSAVYITLTLRMFLCVYLAMITIISFTSTVRTCTMFDLISLTVLTSGVARGGGVDWGVQTPSIEKGVHFYCLVIEQKQWLIIKIVATRCRILRLKCTAPDPAGGAHAEGKGEGERGKGDRTPSITNFWLRHWFWMLLDPETGLQGLPTLCCACSWGCCYDVRISIP